MILRLICPSGHVLDVDSQLAGRKIRCGACGRLMLVPSAKGNRAARKPSAPPPEKFAGKPPEKPPEKPSEKPPEDRQVAPPASVPVEKPLAAPIEMPGAPTTEIVAEDSFNTLTDSPAASLEPAIVAEPPAEVIEKLTEPAPSEVPVQAPAEVAALEISTEAPAEVSTFQSMSAPVMEEPPAEMPLAEFADVAGPTISDANEASANVPFEPECLTDVPTIAAEAQPDEEQFFAEASPTQAGAAIVAEPPSDVPAINESVEVPVMEAAAGPWEESPPEPAPSVAVVSDRDIIEAFTPPAVLSEPAVAPELQIIAQPPTPAPIESLAAPSVDDILGWSMGTGLAVEPTVTFARKPYEWERPAINVSEPVREEIAAEVPAAEVPALVPDEPSSLPAEAGTPAPIDEHPSPPTWDPPAVFPFHTDAAASPAPNVSTDAEPDPVPAVLPMRAETPSEPAASVAPQRRAVSGTTALAPTPEHNATARQLAAAVATAAAVSLLPAIIGGYLNPFHAPPWALWTMLLAVVQIVYAGWLVNAPDWVTARVQMIVAATATTIYAMVMTLVLVSPSGRPLILGLGNVRAMATMWCALMFLVLGGLTWYCGWTSARWKREMMEEWPHDRYRGRI